MGASGDQEDLRESAINAYEEYLSSMLKRDVSTGDMDLSSIASQHGDIDIDPRFTRIDVKKVKTELTLLARRIHREEKLRLECHCLPSRCHTSFLASKILEMAEEINQTEGPVERTLVPEKYWVKGISVPCAYYIEGMVSLLSLLLLLWMSLPLLLALFIIIFSERRFFSPTKYGSNSGFRLTVLSTHRS